MTQKMTKLALAATLLAGMLVLGGCGKSSEEKTVENAIEQGTGGKAEVDIDRHQITIKTKEGETIQAASGENMKVPADFPKDVFVYPDAKVEASAKTGAATQLMLATPDAVTKVADEYKAQMKKSGWSETSTASMEGMTMLQYAKGGLSVMIHVTGEEKTTKIMIVISKEEEAAK